MSNQRVLIDTSVWIHVLRRDAPPELAEDVRRMILERRAATTGIVVLELLAGMRTEQEYREVREDLEALPNLPTDDAWTTAWDLAFRLRRRGVTVPCVDTVIAATAMAHRCVLFHLDEHFQLIAHHAELATRQALLR